MGCVGLSSVHQAGVSLVDSLHAVVEAELGEALHDLVRAELFVRDARRAHRAGVLVYVFRFVLHGFEVETARLEDELGAGFLFHLAPGFVGVGGEGGVLGCVIGEADDARVVL